ECVPDRPQPDRPQAGGYKHLSNRLRGFLLRRQRASDLFHPRRKAMAVLFTAYHGLARHPVELNDATRARKRLVPVPWLISATGSQQRPFLRPNPQNHILEIVSRTKQSEPATGRFPSRIHIDQDRDDFRLRVSVDFAVFFATTAAHCDHVGPIRQVEAELVLKRLTKLIASHLLDQLCKR